MRGVLKLEVILILSVILVLSASDGSLLLSIKEGNGKSLQGQSKMVVGSRPPGCVNKCSSCRPCVAALVITGRRKFARDGEFMASRRIRSRQEDDDGYYLLSWKCRCGDKIFQP